MAAKNRLKNRTSGILSKLKHTSIKKGIPFNLSIGDIPQMPDRCPVLGITLEFVNGQGYKHSRPSVDRIVPKLGYVKGNIRIISSRANLLKSDATVEELELVLADLKMVTGK